MGKIRNTADLHPTTVQKVAKNAIMTYRGGRPTRTRRATPVKRRHYLDGVDPLIVAWIRENKIFYKRVEVVDSTTVIIHNPKGK